MIAPCRGSAKIFLDVRNTDPVKNGLNMLVSSAFCQITIWGVLGSFDSVMATTL